MLVEPKTQVFYCTAGNVTQIALAMNNRLESISLEEGVYEPRITQISHQYHPERQHWEALYVIEWLG